MTVKARISMLLGCALVGFLGLTGLNEYLLDQVFTTTNYANINTVPSVMSLATARNSFNQLRIRVFRHIFTNDAVKMTEIDASINEAQATIEDALKKYEPLISDDEDKQLLADDRALLTEYLHTLKPVLLLSRQNKDVQAHNALVNADIVARNLYTAIERHVAHNERLGKRYADDAVEAKHRAANLSRTIALLMLATVGAMGLLIIRSLQQQLGGEPGKAAEIANRIAVGDLSVRIDLRPGDTSSLMAAMENMSASIQALVVDSTALSVAAQEGRLDVRAGTDRHKGDFYKIVIGINNTLDAMIEPIHEASRVLAALEQGNLSQRITAEYHGQFRRLRDSVNNTVDKLAHTIEQVMAATETLSHATGEVSATAQSIAQMVNEQAVSVEETSSSIEQMSASIRQNAENAKVTDTMAAKSAKEAHEGGVAVMQTVTAMKSIADMINIINDIAGQTNLLALNAAIEAARAGDQGKGFAVVAAEIRKLSERSQMAAQEIGELAGNSVVTAEKAGQMLKEIVPSVTKTSDLVQEIACASEEQSCGVEQIGRAMDQLNRVTHQSASISEELAATAEEMSEQAEQLRKHMGFFSVNKLAEQRKDTCHPSTNAHGSPISSESELAAPSITAGNINEAEFVRF
ncbi:methyl-accepting chemotaxis protein [Candidatus Methylospira mobilis]|uniref:Methyl-accepting chemotaxis protein n=1 Tax=Candidatus Methylospira mobilis TaxID=1808979 RepID=A0A5Q0BH02_9GAMM|nr:methyl-accepting chemotaxis protein [Candidatus Methylospira mobilis]QFY43103.1 methyl-accepting chemotaxis protein [Candidatus Methylospira mobilis]